MAKLKTKRVVVTGGSSGIGFAICRLFVDEGADVLAVGRREDQLRQAREAIGVGLRSFQADVTSIDDLDRLFQSVAERGGGIDILVANAGSVERQPLSAATPEHFDRQFNANARSVYFTVAKALPLMSCGGSIILISSGSRKKGVAGLGSYAAAKAAVHSFAKSWAVELAPMGIRVNSLSPGLIDTPIHVQQFADSTDVARMHQHVATRAPLSRAGLPEEVAKAALYLASADSSYCTGTDIMVDGGLSIS